MADGVLNGYGLATKGIFPNFDCKNTDYRPGVGGDPDEDEIVKTDRPPDIPSDVNMGNPTGPSFAPCWVQDDFPTEFGDTRAPQIFTDP